VHLTDSEAEHTDAAAITEAELELPTGLTETQRTVRTRRVQGFFRAAVLAR